MTQEKKQLLLNDLCARLPYGVKICVGGYICTLLDINTEMGDKLNGETFHTVGFNKPNGEYDFCTISEVKPYLRPMESMTEKETYIFRQDILNEVEARCICSFGCGKYTLAFTESNDWLNKHHFDYRDLIRKGLALEAPEGMYKTE